MTYEYKVPGERLNLNKDQLEKLIVNWHDAAKPNWKRKYEYYRRHNDIVVQQFTPWYLAILAVSLWPVSVLVNGLNSISEINEELYNLFNQKNTGAFSSFVIFNGMDRIK